MLSNIPDDSFADVSVVIPAYNYACYLPKAIDSALRQEHPPREIIVVDDGSTDNTAQVVACYRPPVRYIHQTNAGLPAARNTGICAATCSYVGFLDADDEWLPGMLARAMKTFAELPENFALVACGTTFVDASGAKLENKCYVDLAPRDISCGEILLKTQFAPSTVVARRCALMDCGLFDPTLRSSEDRDMWVRVAALHRVRMNYDRLVLIRRHGANMSRNSDRMKTAMHTVITKAWRNRLVPRSHLLFWLRVFSFHYFQAAWMYRDDGRYGKALNDMLRSLLLWPCFLHPDRLNEPPLFRVRSLLRFFREGIRGRA